MAYGLRGLAIWAGENAAARLTGASKVTVLRYLEQGGAACMAHHDKAVRGVKASQVECDEIWAFNYRKRANLAKAKAAPEGAGDAWTWTAIDADSKLIVSYLIGNRDVECAQDFMFDLADRLATRVQLTTDGMEPISKPLWARSGIDVDYAQLVKHYGPTADMARPERKYSPGECCAVSASIASLESQLKRLFQHHISKSTINPCASICGASPA